MGEKVLERSPERKLFFLLRENVGSSVERTFWFFIPFDLICPDVLFNVRVCHKSILLFLPDRTFVVFLRLHTYRRFRSWLTDQLVAVVVGEDLFHNKDIFGLFTRQGNKKVAGSRYQRLSGVMKALT